MAKLPSSPGVGRPAKGFTTERAQKWVLTAAILTAVIYTFRRLVEPGVNTAPARGGKLAQVTGAGSPPPSLEHWAVSYGVGYLGLAILALGAPEVAASLAMLVVAGSALTNGTSIVADIAGLEGRAPPTSSSGTVAPVAAAINQAPAGIAAGATSIGPAIQRAASGADLGVASMVTPSNATHTAP